MDRDDNRRMNSRNRPGNWRIIRQIDINFRTIMLGGDRAKPFMPKIQIINQNFRRKSEAQQRRLRTVDYRSEWDKLHQTRYNHDRCHVLGVAVCRQVYLYAVHNTNWRPSIETIQSLFVNVVNHVDNFVVCSRTANERWKEGGQEPIMDILNSPYSRIDVPQDKVLQLIRVLHGIRKRFFNTFLQLSLQFGASVQAIRMIEDLFENIYNAAIAVRDDMQQWQQDWNQQDEAIFGN